ncbi:MAG: phenylalanine--tRNA ligase subunit beta [Acidimicrobiia bacterium]
MKVPLRWLQEFIELPTTDPTELSYVLTMLGHEVESFHVLESEWTKVVVGKVEQITPHPDADKVRVCQVDTGSGPQQIICGAWNFSEGAHVAVAQPGAMLPGDFEIGRRTIRGVESNGMICSESELGLGEDHTGILVLDGEPDPGSPFDELVELPDVVFDIAITSNRPDAMSLVGIARDLAARFEIQYRVPDRPLQTVAGSPKIGVQIEDPSGCRRFTAREIRGVKMGNSPLWVRHRLRKAGMRAISNIVDVTNYVMLELGHPLHAFDADTISGDRLTVKRAETGETLETLDGEQRTLTSDDLIIYDAEGPTSMSGTMGGARSEVSESTVNVLMEAASWDPPTIMYMSRRHGLMSEASTRFERGVDPNLTDQANARAAAMVVELGGGSVLDGLIDEIAVEVRPVQVRLTLADVGRLLGPGFTAESVSGILTRLGMTVDGTDPMLVTVPTYRPDVTRPADLIEEVARLHGYDRFGATLPTGRGGGLTPEQKRARRLTSALVGIGMHQTVTLPFVNHVDLAKLGWIETDRLLKVSNPLRDEEATMRPTMLPGLLNVARHNFSYGMSEVALFEMARVFLAEPLLEDPRLPGQQATLAWVIVGGFGPHLLGEEPPMADAVVSISVLRHVMAVLGHLEFAVEPAESPGYHPGRSAAVRLGGSVIGHVGELSPRANREFDLPGRVAIGELDLESLLARVDPVIGVSPSVFPHIDFDLSFLLPADLAVDRLIEATAGAGADLVESARVFDVFRGPGVDEGSRAVAIRYRLRSGDRTLTNEEVSPIRRGMISAAEQLGARLRGA